MASAPAPGVGKRAANAVASQFLLSIRIQGGETYRLAYNIIPVKERMLVRKETGLPLEAFVGEIAAGGANKIGMDTLVLFWWLARRAAGETDLRFNDAADEWPDDLGPDDLEVEVEEPDPENNDPEA